MSLSDEQRQDLLNWAKPHSAIVGIWLFGSRARGDHRPDSDFDIALELAPKKGNHDWALGDYFFEWEKWKSQIKHALSAEVSLVAFRDDLEGKFDPRIGGLLIWSREKAAGSTSVPAA